MGLDVHRAARLCAAGHGGQVLVSQTTRDLIASDPAGRPELARSRRAPPQRPAARRGHLRATHRRPAQRSPGAADPRRAAEQPAAPDRHRWLAASASWPKRRIGSCDPTSACSRSPGPAARARRAWRSSSRPKCSRISPMASPTSRSRRLAIPRSSVGHRAGAGHRRGGWPTRPGNPSRTTSRTSSSCCAWTTSSTCRPRRTGRRAPGGVHAAQGAGHQPRRAARVRRTRLRGPTASAAGAHAAALGRARDPVRGGPTLCRTRPGRQSRLRGHRGKRRPWPRSAIDSTACHWASSWRPLASDCCRPNPCSCAWTAACRC